MSEKKNCFLILSYYINKKVSFSGSKIYVQGQAFDSLKESLSSGVGRFYHMIKLIKGSHTDGKEMRSGL